MYPLPTPIESRPKILLNAGWSHDRNGWHAPNCMGSYSTIEIAWLAFSLGTRCEGPLVKESGHTDAR